jgi:S1-C subfamily serine protease
MGAFMADLPPEAVAQARLPVREGVLIRGVVAGGPAERAGIRGGDIILSVQGKKVSTLSDLTRRLRQELRSSQQVDVELFRDGARRTLKLTLGAVPR